MSPKGGHPNETSRSLSLNPPTAPLKENNPFSFLPAAKAEPRAQSCAVQEPQTLPPGALNMYIIIIIIVNNNNNSLAHMDTRQPSASQSQLP